MCNLGSRNLMVKPSQAVVPALCASVGRGPADEEAVALREQGAWAWQLLSLGLHSRGKSEACFLESGIFDAQDWEGGYVVQLAEVTGQSSDHRGLLSYRVTIYYMYYIVIGI